MLRNKMLRFLKVWLIKKTFTAVQNLKNTILLKYLINWVEVSHILLKCLYFIKWPENAIGHYSSSVLDHFQKCLFSPEIIKTHVC